MVVAVFFARELLWSVGPMLSRERLWSLGPMLARELLWYVVSLLARELLWFVVCACKGAVVVCRLCLQESCCGLLCLSELACVLMAVGEGKVVCVSGACLWFCCWGSFWICNKGYASHSQGLQE